MTPPAVFAAVVAIVAVASTLMTGLVRAAAPRVGLFDVPGARSLHTRPTPRGGGIAVVVSVLAGVAWAASQGLIDSGLARALLLGGGVVGFVGLLDDAFRGLRNSIRLTAWFLAAGGAVWSLGGLTAIKLGLFTLPLGPAGSLLAVVFTVWMINLYNFMDGIDGIAGGQALVAGAAAAGLLAASDHLGLALIAGLIAASAAGFLPWNWSPARIFLGDVGSGFLGFTFAVLALASETAGALPLLAWALLLLPFLVDATLTLARRALAREPLYKAHRSHAYQLAAQRFGRHAPVAAAVVGLDLALAVAAAAGAAHPALLLPLLAAALVFLAIVWLRITAPLRHARGGVSSTTSSPPSR
ncbi:MAG: glycosyltransferase family 4 protein [Euryarchaeota archaeon]|nr:glycosyltransferase family 4 protein [Euryarchaeota archaeon]